MIAHHVDRRRPARGRTSPGGLRWWELVLHHGARLVVLLGVAFAVFLLFPSARVADSAVLERGVIAPEDVIAEFTFQIPKDPDELRREQAQAASGVPPILDYLPAAEDSASVGVRVLFSALDSAVATAAPGEPQRAAVRQVLERYRITPTPGAVDLLVRMGPRAELRAAMQRAIGALLPLGIVSTTFARDGASAVRVRGTPNGERLVPTDSLLAPDQFYRLAVDRLPDSVAAAEAELFRLILIRFFQPSLRLNTAETEAARARARSAVEPIEATVLRGEKIVGAREQIGEREQERLQAYQVAASERGGLPNSGRTPGAAVGAVLFNALVLAIAGVLFWLTRRPLYDDFRTVLLLAGLVLFVVGVAGGIARMEWPPELIPITFAALAAAVLWDVRSALVLALVLALLVGAQTPFLGVTVLFTAALGGAAAAFSVRAAQRRSRNWLFVVVISAAYAAAAVVLGLLRARGADAILESIGWGVTNAVLSSLVALGFLPLLEAFARVTTDQTLLELSDTNRPLLRRLQREANGTYHHTINVASLVERACNAIGANALLARVGAYYHDVGKLSKPQYFIENQPVGRNPHDKLKPAMSAAIVRSHVPEGLRLAHEARLPAGVRAFIAEHHGTQQISFFLARARELAGDEQSVNPHDFSYAGPKPQSRETAVLMLADSVESAAHVLADPTPERLREMVDRIVAGKVAAGQLDECPLTLRDLQTIREHLATVLAGMFHHRIDYPPALPAEPRAEREPAPVVARLAGGAS